MPKLNVLAGGYRGKLGDTIGSRTKGNNIIKTAFKPTNPNSLPQQENRTEWGKLITLLNKVGESVKSISAYRFYGSNYSAEVMKKMKTLGMNATNYELENIPFAYGALKPPNIRISYAPTQWYIANLSQESEYNRAEIKITVIFIDVTTHKTVVETFPISTQQTTVQIPQGFEPHPLILAFTSAKYDNKHANSRVIKASVPITTSFIPLMTSLQDPDNFEWAGDVLGTGSRDPENLAYHLTEINREPAISQDGNWFTVSSNQQKELSLLFDKPSVLTSISIRAKTFFSQQARDERSPRAPTIIENAAEIDIGSYRGGIQNHIKTETVLLPRDNVGGWFLADMQAHALAQAIILTVKGASDRSGAAIGGIAGQRLGKILADVGQDARDFYDEFKIDSGYAASGDEAPVNTYKRDWDDEFQDVLVSSSDGTRQLLAITIEKQKETIINGYYFKHCVENLTEPPTGIRTMSLTILDEQGQTIQNQSFQLQAAEWGEWFENIYWFDRGDWTTLEIECKMTPTFVNIVVAALIPLVRT